MRYLEVGEPLTLGKAEKVNRQVVQSMTSM